MTPTTTWKRLATIGAAMAVVAGMSPFVAAVTANALSPGTGHVDLVDPLNGTAVSSNNGNDDLQHLYADVLQATGAHPQIAFVRFTYTDTTTSGPQTTIATVPVNPKSAGPDQLGDDSFAVATWPVPGNTDDYTITAIGLEANQSTMVSNSSTTVTDLGTADGATSTRPRNNSLVGYYALTSRLNVAGTSGSNGDSTQVRDTPTGGTGGALPFSTASYDQLSTRWAADIAIDPGEVPTAGVNTSLTGVESTVSLIGGTEDAAGTAYLQTFAPSPNGFTMTPASGSGCTASHAPPFPAAPSTADCANGTSSNPFQVYTMQATDQHGNPISGLPVDLTLNDPASSNTAHLEFRSTEGSPTWTEQAFSDNTPVPAPSTNDYGTPAGQLVTNEFGQVTFRISNTSSEIVSVEAKSKFNGSFVNGSDYDLHGQYSTTAQVSTSGTATIVGHPTAPLYATQAYGLGTARLGPTPGIQVNVKDASNNNIQGATVQYSYVRHVTSGNNVAGCSDPNHYPVTVPSDPSSTALNSDPSDANGNTFITPDAVDAGHAPYLQSASSPCTTTEVGNDVFTVYIDKNGVPGYQSAGDLLLGTDTLSFGPESIYFKPCDQISLYEGGQDPNAGATYQDDCQSQQRAGTDLPLTVFASIWDGTTRQPLANRAIDITITPPDSSHHMVFSANGNSGLTPVNSFEGNITTNAGGTATVTVTDPVAGEGGERVTASDPSLTDAIGSDDGADDIFWRSFSPALNCADSAGTFRYTGEVTPLGSVSPLVGSPGQPLIEGFELDDQNGDPLACVPVTITTSAGFLTDLPNVFGHGAGADAVTFSALHFDGADASPVDGATITGNLHSNGTTETVITGNDGKAYFALGVKGDPGFAQNGMLAGKVTAQLGGAGTTLTLPDNDGFSNAANGTPAQVLFSTDSQVNDALAPGGGLHTYGSVAALNPASSNPLSLVAGLFDNNGRYHVLGIPPSGDKATTSTNTIPVDTVDATSTQLDGFGNPVSELIDVSTSGVNGPDSGSYFGAYGWVNNATADSLGFHADTDFCTSNSSAQSEGACPQIADELDRYVNQMTNPASNVPLVGAETLTADWNANHTAWLVNSTTHAVSINVTDSPDPTKSYTVNWYDREASGFKYQTSSTPSGSKHHAGTPVTTTVQVLDSKNRPVNDLGVEFIRSGPGGETQDTGNPFTCNDCPNVQFTNVGGRAGFTFTSQSVGKYTVTAIVTDGSGNEVGRATSSGKLTGSVIGKVSIHGKHRVLKGSRHKLHGSAPANHTVKIFRGGKKIATVHSNGNGKWFKKLKFKKSHVYYVVSGGATSADLHVVVHKKHKKHKKH